MGLALFWVAAEGLSVDASREAIGGNVSALQWRRVETFVVIDPYIPQEFGEMQERRHKSVRLG